MCRYQALHRCCRVSIESRERYTSDERALADSSKIVIFELKRVKIYLKRTHVSQFQTTDYRLTLGVIFIYLFMTRVDVVLSLIVVADCKTRQVDGN